MAGGAVLLNSFCNIFGGEGSNIRNLGGLGAMPQVKWFCKNRSAGRFVMTCFHGHRGQIMEICEAHYDEFKDTVRFCPRCNMEPPGHRCRLKIRAVS